jgi:hypothetical protein
MWLALQVALVFALAGAAAVAPWVGQSLRFDPPIIGAFTGALIGAAATMLGGLLVRLNAKADKASFDANRRSKIRTLITAELVNVALSYPQLQRTIRAAQETLYVRGTMPTLVDFSNEMPRSMPFTSALGAELLILSPQENRRSQYTESEHGPDPTAASGCLHRKALLRPLDFGLAQPRNSARHGYSGSGIREDRSIAEAGIRRSTG